MKYPSALYISVVYDSERNMVGFVEPIILYNGRKYTFKPDVESTDLSTQEFGTDKLLMKFLEAKWPGYEIA